MPKLLIAFASAMLLLASSGIWKANAATITNAGTLSPLTKSYTPVEEVGWRRSAYRRGYYGYAYPAYPYYGGAYPAYPYSGYGSRVYEIGPPSGPRWGWGY